MTPEERNELIAKYAAGYEEVAQALNGFPAESLNARLIPGKWSAREIVHHLGDSESTSAFRLRKLLVHRRKTTLWNTGTVIQSGTLPRLTSLCPWRRLPSAAGPSISQGGETA